MTSAHGEVTTLLAGWSRGDTEALERLMPLVFEDLRQIARKLLRGESEPISLAPTALVHEVYLRLVGQRQAEWSNRAEFFAFAAVLMRRILVSHAKSRRSVSDAVHSKKNTTTREDLDVLALDEALDELSTIDPIQARLVELRYFLGLSEAEAATALDLSLVTVKREWRSARLWLYREIRQSDATQSREVLAFTSPVDVVTRRLARGLALSFGLSSDELIGLMSAPDSSQFDEAGMVSADAESLMLIVRLQEVLPEDDFRAWLRRPNPELEGRSPLNLIHDGKARIVADLVEDLLSGSPM